MGDDGGGSDLELEQQRKDIDELLLAPEVDVLQLRALSRRRGGFLDQSTRARVWPKLLEIARPEASGALPELHKDDDQIRCDVERSLWSVDVTIEWDTTVREKRRAVLRNLIKLILKQHGEFHYFQVRFLVFPPLFSSFFFV